MRFSTDEDRDGGMEINTVTGKHVPWGVFLDVKPFTNDEIRISNYWQLSS